MKNLKDIILEKLIINKDINIKDIKEPELIMGEKTCFIKEEIDNIKELCHELPIVPDAISNYNYVSPKLSKGHNSSYGSSFINLIYYINPEDFKISTIKNNGRNNNIIRIKKDSETSQYFVRFIKVDETNTDFFPTEPDKYFKSIKECFNCIKEHWDKLKFSEVINKYK